MSMNGLKVAIVGGNGRIGRLLLSHLRDDKRFAMPLSIVRTKEQVKFFKEEMKVDASLTSIEHSSVDELTAAIKGYDAVIFSAGAGGKGVERIFTVDLDGCVKTIEACGKAGIKRLIVVSAIKAEDRRFWWDIEGLREYYIAKRAADHDVRHSDLDYTILQPAFLTNGERTEKFTPLDKVDYALAHDGNSVHRDDVAYFAIQCLLNPEKTKRKTIPLVNGEISANELISQL